ncbi:MAG: glycosyltransferase family 39 protein [Coleofasciculaceae cyanobacterium]
MMKPIVRQGLKIKEWQPTKAWGLAILWLLVIGFLAFFWNLGSTGLIDETEPLFAEAARQMTVTGDWITPYFNGVTRFDKPPLIYWLMAIAYSTFGVNEFAARLPSALAGVALTSLLFYTLRQFGGWGIPKFEQTPDATKSDNTAIRQWQSWLVAGLGSAMVALNPITLFFGRTGYSDMLLSLCFGGSLLAFFIGYAQPEQPKIQERWYLAVYVLFGLAVLTKGPVGIVLPGLIIVSFLFYLGKTKEVLQEMQVVRGSLIFLVIAVPWFILVTLQNGEVYINSFFGVHNFERFTNVVNQHQGPIYFHLLIVLIGFAPWSIGLPSAIASINVFQRQRFSNLPRQAHLGLFALFWFFIVLGFFTIAVTKYFSYTLPLMPAAAILLALWWSEQIVQGQIFHQSSLSLKITTVVSIVFFAVLAVACFYCPQWLGDDSTMPNLGVRISQDGISNIGAVIWGISAIAGLILLLRRQAYWLCSVQFLGFLAFLMFAIMPASAIIDSERQLPLRQIAQAVVQDAKPGEETVMIANGFEKPTLVFYSQRPITFLMRPTETIPYIQNTNKPRSSNSLLLIATEQALKKSGLEATQYQAVSQSGIYQLVRVLKSRVIQ